MQTIVIGHRNPDMDSICAAIGYAALKRALGQTNTIAGRAGETNERIDFVLEKFGIEAPQHFTDVSPRVADVMERNVLSMPATSPVYDAIQLIEQKGLRGLPIVDEAGRCRGLLSATKITHHLFPSRDAAASARMVHASLADVVTTFGGSLISGALAEKAEDLLFMVGSISEAAFPERLKVYAKQYAEKKVIVFVGDRPGILKLAIEAGVYAVVVTGGSPVIEERRLAARQAGVTLISSPHDTATTVLLSRGAVQTGEMVNSDFLTFRPDQRLDEARRVAAENAAFVFPVAEDDGRIVGILSKSDFLKLIPRQLILVDHNELTQAVRGADTIPIIEVLDHHKLGGFSSHTPVFFWNNPVGSTSTLVALSYRSHGIEIPPPIAGLLLAGLISDTLNLTSPTTTAVDREILAHLEQRANLTATELAGQIFSVGSPLLTMSPEQAVGADSKLYEERGIRFSVAQIEELTFAHFPEKQGELIAALEAARERAGLHFAALLVTDINTQSSLLLVRGSDAFTAQIDYPEYAPHIWELSGVVSRKKQLLPYLLRCLEKMS